VKILGAALIALPLVFIVAYGAIMSHSFAIGVGVAIVFGACLYFGCKLMDGNDAP